MAVDQQIAVHRFTEAQWSSPAQGSEECRIEFAQFDELIALRDSTEPNGPYLIFDIDEWEAFLAGVRLGEFDPDQLTGSACCTQTS